MLSFLAHLSLQDSIDKFCQSDKKVSLEIKSEVPDLELPLIEENSDKYFERSSSVLSRSGYSKKYQVNSDNRATVDRELQLYLKLMTKGERPVSDLLSCNVSKVDGDDNKSVVVLNFDAFYDVTTEYFRTNIYSKPLSYRIKAYTSAAGALAEIHDKDIVHCSISPINIGSPSLSCSTLKFKDLSSAISLEGDDIRICAKSPAFSNPKDLLEEKCLIKENAKRADVWAFGLALLHIELDINSVSSNFFLKNQYLKQKGCFTDQWTNDCTVQMNDLIEQMGQDIITRNPFEEDLAESFKDLIRKTIDDCDKRPSSKELYVKMGQLAFRDAFSSIEDIRQTRPGILARLCRALCAPSRRHNNLI